ncbi:GDP-mannose-dependent alpha-(1-6)-phosphatidylinositol monomannoside mannosyltransferase [Marinomonas gallaica]|uniref:GDP-mannose-dependent alpha-(1-6)-phosphatidylinositol monomannoside mannosyltransferase n=1 Tax=Marinomonas gallaica TaxID=1806667 RepID=A0A1C3JUU4_9GAMM|nr:glycosyltransferase [Marinomonas gallaica]SBT18963.1 GDP-mannose-dependent alpha-(1-6)-phosphatidylinositol monomannoside mannosyltransferase [Marinomonas gallaica]SBT21918.1 GDP-mannose-dependent alpha-(1-6)-phosphatidylinositol monomannoside mannosyltransferase [Marinomonas gallaica]
MSFAKKAINVHPRALKVAIVHDWLVAWAGAEKVLEQMLDIWPQADIYCMVDTLSSTGEVAVLKGKNITPSFIQGLPFAKKHYRLWLPLMPLAVEQFDLSGYDLVVSSSHAVAKGVITGPDTYHLCYCYSPMRYAWDLQHEYLRGATSLLSKLKQWPMRYLLHRLRLWDVASSLRPDKIVAISNYIARRIDKCYRRKADVVYPPVDTERLTPYYIPTEQKKSYYIAASRLVPYKRIQLIAEAFAQMPDKSLIIIGDGPERPALERYLATLPSTQTNVSYLGYQEDDDLYRYLSEARAMIFAAEEDFGILPVEAQAVGTPVIAFGRGGATETVVSNKTGLFFNEASRAGIIDAVAMFEAKTWDSQQCVHNAEKFSNAVFKAQLKQHILFDGHPLQQDAMAATTKTVPVDWQVTSLK